MPGQQNSISQTTEQVINTGKKLIEMLGASVTKEITDAMTAISGIAEKGTIIFLQTFGAALIITCIALKIQVGDHTLANLTRSEYIVTVTVGLLFVLAGTSMRFYILKCALEAQKALSQTGREIMKSQAAAANAQIENITESASDAANRQPKLPPST